jgi:hypothetical protein
MISRSIGKAASAPLCMDHLSQPALGRDGGRGAISALQPFLADLARGTLLTGGSVTPVGVTIVS